MSVSKADLGFQALTGKRLAIISNILRWDLVTLFKYAATALLLLSLAAQFKTSSFS